jgi:hypothetical protein
MRFRILISFLFVSGSAFWIYHELYPKSNLSSVPVAVFPAVVDLGNCQAGSTVHAEWKVENRGGHILQLIHFQSSCGCSGVEVQDGHAWVVPKEISIKPGETQVCRVRMLIPSEAGRPKISTVHFETNDPAMPEGLMTISVREVIGVTFQPVALTYGTLPIGKNSTQEIELINIGTTKARFVSVRPLVSSQLHWKFLPYVSSQGGDKVKLKGECLGKIQFTLEGSQPINLYEEVIVNFARDDGTTFSHKFVVSGGVVGQFSISPTAIYLPRQSGQGPIYLANIIISALDAAPFHVELPQDPRFRFYLNPQLAGSKNQILEVEYQGPKKDVPMRMSLPLTIRRGQISARLPLIIQIEE